MISVSFYKNNKMAKTIKVKDNFWSICQKYCKHYQKYDEVIIDSGSEVVDYFCRAIIPGANK